MDGCYSPAGSRVTIVDLTALQRDRGRTARNPPIIRGRARRSSPNEVLPGPTVIVPRRMAWKLKSVEMKVNMAGEMTLAFRCGVWRSQWTRNSSEWDRLAGAG